MLENQSLFKSILFNPETSLQPITNAFHLIDMRRRTPSSA